MGDITYRHPWQIRPCLNKIKGNGIEYIIADIDSTNQKNDNDLHESERNNLDTIKNVMNENIKHDDNVAPVSKNPNSNIDQSNPIILTIDTKNHTNSSYFIDSTNNNTPQQKNDNKIFAILKKNISPQKRHHFLHESQVFFYMNFSAYAILGFIIRYYLNELFHSGCIDESEIYAATHYSLLCVTSSNTSLFMDLPANLLGCFIIGFMTTSAKITNKKEEKVIPWIHSKHYFQNRPKMHLAIRTGFCGSLTTFASWNAQMVQMICSWNMSKIVLAVYGYVLGVQSCYMSLKFGQYISFTLYCWWEMRDGTNIENDDSNSDDKKDNDEEIVIIQQEHVDDELQSYKSEIVREEEDDDECKISRQECVHTVLPFLITIPLFIYFLCQSISTKSISSSIERRNAYREIWLSCFFAPMGAIIRYKLSSAFNTSQKSTNIPYLGTFIANITGSVIAVVCISFIILIQVLGWQQDVLYAIKLGFAGCLSTVSTFLDEFDTLLKHPVSLENRRAYWYVYGTLLTACLLGICIYAPVAFGVNAYG